MSAAELFGLVVSILVFVYLVYALLRGERSVDRDGPGLAADRVLRRRC